MQQQPLNTVPPIGNADGSAAGGSSQISYLIKIMMFNSFQNKVATHKGISEKKKMQVYLIMFVVYFWYSNKSFIETRPKTLYDIMDISRVSNFDEIKTRKNEILKGLNDIDNETFEGNKTLLQQKYNMTKTELKDMYNVLTNHHLREVYDKYNVWYNYDDFVKQKGKNIPTFEKYMQTLKGVLGLAPFLMIIYMSFGDEQPTGKTLAILGYCLSIYFILQLKLPNPSARRESDMLEFINEHYNHKYVIKVLGSTTDRWTVHQFSNYFKDVLWNVYFQMAQSFSRLIDIPLDQIFESCIANISNKHTKTLHIFEIMRPIRGMEALEDELSDRLKAILKLRREEADGKSVLDGVGLKLITGKGKIMSKAKPQCKKFDDMRYLEVAPYRKTAGWNPTYPCDMCKKPIDVKKGFYNCMKCKYDLCLDCSGHNESISKQQKAIAEEEEAKKNATQDSDLKPGPFADQVKEILADKPNETGDKDVLVKEEAKQTEDDQLSKEEAQGKDFEEIPTVESQKLEAKEIEESVPATEEVKAEKTEEKLEEQDKKQENEVSIEVAKVEGSESKETDEKKNDEAPKPDQIIQTAQNKYYFVGDKPPPTEANEKLMQALATVQPETFEDELYTWPEIVDPKHRAMFDALKKKEERLNELTETLAKKDKDLVDKAKETAPSSRLAMGNLRAEEWKDVNQTLKKPIPPAHRLYIIANSSWGKYVIGAFKFVLEQRKIGMIKSMKIQVERDLAKQKKGWTQSRKFLKWTFFGYMSLLIPMLLFPQAAFYFVKVQIRQGEWGDFSTPAPMFEKEDDEIEDFNDAFVDIEKEFDDEDKEENDEGHKEGVDGKNSTVLEDAKNSTVSEEPSTQSEESAQNEVITTESKTPDAENEVKAETKTSEVENEVETETQIPEAENEIPNQVEDGQNSTVSEEPKAQSDESTSNEVKLDTKIPETVNEAEKQEQVNEDL